MRTKKEVLPGRLEIINAVFDGLKKIFKTFKIHPAFKIFKICMHDNDEDCILLEEVKSTGQKSQEDKV